MQKNMRAKQIRRRKGKTVRQLEEYGNRKHSLCDVEFCFISFSTNHPLLPHHKVCSYKQIYVYDYFYFAYGVHVSSQTTRIEQNIRVDYEHAKHTAFISVHEFNLHLLNSQTNREQNCETRWNKKKYEKKTAEEENICFISVEFHSVFCKTLYEHGDLIYLFDVYTIRIVNHIRHSAQYNAMRNWHTYMYGEYVCMCKS